MIKVAIDASPLKSGHNVRGIGVNTRELIKNLKKISSKDILVDAVDIKSKDLDGYDIVHITHFNPFFVSFPLFKPKQKVLITIHDLIPLKYPKQYPPGIKGQIRFLLQKLFIKKLGGILTISNDSKKDIVKYLKVKKEKIHVVYLAAKSIFKKITDVNMLHEVRKKYGLPKKFVLYVGDVNYNKNILMLIKTCEETKIPLVLVGKKAKDIEGLGMELIDIKGPRDWFRFLLNIPHPETTHYKTIYDKFQSSNNIIRTGYVSDSDLVAIYNLATVYVQPSFAEGFGFSVLEAQACGTPVIASDIAAHREISGGACLFFDPSDIKSLTKKLITLFESPKTMQKLSTAGLENSKKYTWEKTAKETLKIYEKVLGRY